MIVSEARGATSLRQLSNKNAVRDGEKEDSQPHLPVQLNLVKRYLSLLTVAPPAGPTLFQPRDSQAHSAPPWVPDLHHRRLSVTPCTRLLSLIVVVRISVGKHYSR